MLKKILITVIGLLPCFASAQSPLDALPPFDSLNYDDARRCALQMSERAAFLHSYFSENAREVGQQRLMLEDRIAASKNDSLVSKDSLKILGKSLKELKNVEKKALKQQKEAEKALITAAGWIDKDTAALLAYLPRMRNALRAPDNAYIQLTAPPVVEEKIPEETPVAETPPAPEPSAPEPEPDAPAKVKTKEKAARPTQPRFYQYNAAQDVMLHPPAAPCVLAVNTRDEFSGELRREVKRAELFHFTHEYLRAYLKDKPHITCEAALASAGQDYYLNLTFTIQDANARKSFGALGKNAVAILKFIDGGTFTLYNQRADEGVMDGSGSVATYRGQYSSDKALLKKMQKTELDKIRIAWSTGYEDYEVYDVDLLMRQSECLEQ